MPTSAKFVSSKSDVRILRNILRLPRSICNLASSRARPDQLGFPAFLRACHHESHASGPPSDRETSFTLYLRINVTIPCYQIPYAIAGGPANMALDEAILEWVGQPAGCGVLAYLRLARTDTQPGVLSGLERGPGRAPLARGSTGSPRHGRRSDLARSRTDLRRRPSRQPRPGTAELGALPGGARGHRLVPACGGAGRLPTGHDRARGSAAPPARPPASSFFVLYRPRSRGYRGRWLQGRGKCSAPPRRGNPPARFFAPGTIGPDSRTAGSLRSGRGLPRPSLLVGGGARDTSPGRWSLNRSHAICLPPSATGPPSWKERIYRTRFLDRHGDEVDRTGLSTEQWLQEQSSANRCVPKIRRRLDCQGSWKSETLSYNVGESLGGVLFQSTSNSRRSEHTSITWSVWIGPWERARKLRCSSQSGGSSANTRRDRDCRSAGQPDSGSILCFCILPLGGKLDS